MKKLCCAVLILGLAFGLCACADETSEAVKDPGSFKIEMPEIQAPEVEIPAPTPTPTPAPEKNYVTVTLTDADATGLDLPEDKICVIDEEGMQILIALEGNARQVRLCAPVYDDNLNFLGTGDTLWSGGDMPEGGEIGLRVYLPDVTTNVVLCYTDDMGEHFYGIFQSGEDGSLLLNNMINPYFSM